MKTLLAVILLGFAACGVAPEELYDAGTQPQVEDAGFDAGSSVVPPLKCMPRAPQCCVDGGVKPPECGP